MDKLFSQSILAHLTRLSPNTVSRAITTLGVESVKTNTRHTKKYETQSARTITNYLYAKSKRPIKEKVQVFYNFKGGTGKTTICYQVATHLSLLGFNVLAIDLDPQGHLSRSLGLPEGWNGPTAYDILVDDFPMDEALLQVQPQFDLLPANISMTRIEVPLSAKTKREEKLKVILDAYRDKYDYIIIDTNPTISTLNMNALVASDRVNIVCETQPFSLMGLKVLVEEMVSFYQDMGIDPNYCIIPNKYEIKTATAQEVLGALRTEFGDLVMSAVVRKCEELNIANKIKQPVAAFCKSKSLAFEDVMDLVHTLVEESREEYSQAA